MFMTYREKFGYDNLLDSFIHANKAKQNHLMWCPFCRVEDIYLHDERALYCHNCFGIYYRTDKEGIYWGTKR